MKDVSERLCLTEVEENDCNDTPVCDDNAHKVVCELSKIQALLMSVKTISKILLKLNGEKKMRKRQDLCNCCDHKFTSLTRLKAHIEVVHEGVNHAIIVIINSIQRTDLGSTGNHFHECVRQSCN